MSDITKIKVNGDPESSYQLYPRNEEFAKRAEDPQPDWNQNDSTAADYVKNRPFYTGDLVETVLVEESTVPFTSPVSGTYYAEIQSTFNPTAGKTYKVYWDGGAYECVCKTVSGYSVIGNLSIMGAGADTGEPFVITILADSSSIEIYTKDTSASHTFSISELVGEVVKIPDKYISDAFRDVIIAGDPLVWSDDEWNNYYDLFQGGKLLKINSNPGSLFEGYALSMFYKAGVSTKMSVITSTGNFFNLSLDSTTNELYWVPILNLNMLYFSYQETGHQKEYQRLEVSDGLEFTTKTLAEDPVQRKVVLEGDKELILSSSTADSTKKFKITVDDSGTLTATEITQ